MRPVICILCKKPGHKTNERPDFIHKIIILVMGNFTGTTIEM